MTLVQKLELITQPPFLNCMNFILMKLGLEKGSLLVRIYISEALRHDEVGFQFLVTENSDVFRNFLATNAWFGKANRTNALR